MASLLGQRVTIAGGRTCSLADLAKEANASFVAFVVYPKASTPGCTKQVCAFRDGFSELLTGYSCLPIGVSDDSEAAQSAFATKNNVNYPLVANGAPILTQLQCTVGSKIVRSVILVHVASGEVAFEAIGVTPVAALPAILEALQSKGVGMSTVKGAASGATTALPSNEVPMGDAEPPVAARRKTSRAKKEVAPEPQLQPERVVEAEPAAEPEAESGSESDDSMTDEQVEQLKQTLDNIGPALIAKAAKVLAAMMEADDDSSDKAGSDTDNEIVVSPEKNSSSGQPKKGRAARAKAQPPQKNATQPEAEKEVPGPPDVSGASPEVQAKPTSATRVRKAPVAARVEKRKNVEQASRVKLAEPVSKKIAKSAGDERRVARTTTKKREAPKVVKPSPVTEQKNNNAVATAVKVKEKVVASSKPETASATPKAAAKPTTAKKSTTTKAGPAKAVASKPAGKAVSGKGGDKGLDSVSTGARSTATKAGKATVKVAKVSAAKDAKIAN